ncbi:hypothetical protein [Neobacillus citreus]|uniref:Uncharacterized protein n=1 Tax=Neobacillus citreus TaxID=2833578 RepID=A0A942T3T4_9BACI|nr:hypothetical protein [Neobacillus citreus]MCH6264335.1 hypothetical protein [Neobacillus citreus]
MRFEFKANCSSLSGQLPIVKMGDISNTPYFITSVKNLTGLTPVLYRQLHEAEETK